MQPAPHHVIQQQPTHRWYTYVHNRDVWYTYVHNRDVWYAEVAHQAVQRYAAEHPVHHVTHHYEAPANAYTPVYKYVPKHARTFKHTAAGVAGRCGGDLPPCYVMERESGGSLTAKNPSSTASGKWQFLDSTWNHFGGYAHASDAPESVQDARAREVWNHGAGASAWAVR